MNSGPFIKLGNGLLKALRPDPLPLLFEHVPKCGGTTLVEFFKTQYHPSRIFEIKGWATQQSIKEFLDLTEAEQSSFDLIIGHGAHGIRNYSRPGTIRATVLRDPVDRIISHYYYVLSSTDHYLHEQVSSKKMSLAEYASSDLIAEMKNNYIKRFCGADLLVSGQKDGSIPAMAYEYLKAEFHVIGLLEDLDGSIEEVRQKAKLPLKFSNRKRNVNSDRPTMNEVDDEVIELIKRSNLYDVELYDLIRKGRSENS